jgi:hypothetical protein
MKDERSVQILEPLYWLCGLMLASTKPCVINALDEAHELTHHVQADETRVLRDHPIIRRSRAFVEVRMSSIASR